MDAETKKMVDLATNPQQYDLSTIHWSQEGDPTTPWRKYCRQVLLRELGDLAGEDVIDIGSGTGQLSTLFPHARRLVGIEPSKHNAEFSKKEHPALEVLNTSLEEADPEGDFDVAIAMMSFEHILDLEKAFAKIYSFLRPAGTLCILSYDFNYAQHPRYGRDITVKPLDEGTVVTEAVHDFGTLHDIIHTPEKIVSAAGKHGFTLDRQLPQEPSEELMTEDPKRRAFAGTPVVQVYIFKRDTSSP